MLSDMVTTPNEVVTLHGTEVSDPYRWLEKRESVETQSWLKVQASNLEGYYSTLGSLRALEQMVRRDLDVQTVSQLGKVAGRYFYAKRLQGQQQARIYSMDAGSRAERLLVDSDRWGPYASVAIHRISDDGRLLACELKQGGEHPKSIHLLDVDTGKVLGDQLGRGLARGFAFRARGDGFYYCHEAADITSQHSGDHQILFHRFAAPNSEDLCVFNLPREGASKLILKSEGSRMWALYYREVSGALFVDLYSATQDDDRVWRAVFAKVRTPFGPFFHGGRLFAYRYDKAPNCEIVELDTVSGEFRRVIVPETDNPIKQSVVIGSCIIVRYVVGTDTIARVWSLEGKDIGSLALDKGKTWRLLPKLSARADEFFLESESFAELPTLYRCSVDRLQKSLWLETRGVTRRRLSVRHSSYRSKDGTEVNITLVAKARKGTSGPSPVVMTGYGGFGLTLTPQYSTFISLLLDLGFVFALPAIRGGSEKGQHWHEAARRRYRQRAFDDFIAAAEWLADQGIAIPKKLAVFGGSNAGLLVAAAITQRPDLFRAAICLAPLLDMIRYHLFDRAKVWANEYGTSDDPDDFPPLFAYSPYHHVKEHINYPAIMFVCGDKDSRCNPAHVRKMAARLQNRSEQSNPILVDHSSERGHAATMPLDVRVTGIARRIAFLCTELDIPFAAGKVL